MSNNNAQAFAAFERAQAKFNQQQWQAAKDLYLEVLELVPGHPQTLLQLSYVESYLDHHRAAHDYAMRAAASELRSPELLASLVSRLRTFSEAEALHQAIAKLPPVSEVSIPLLLTFAAQLSYINEQERSLEFLEEALRADPDYPPTLMAFGQIMTYLGRFNEAEQHFEKCIARAPQSAQAHWFLSRLRKQTPSSNHVGRLCRQLEKRSSGPEDPVLLYFALHKELDDLKDYAAAWEALQRACQMKRRLLQYSSAESVSLVDKLVEWSASRAPATQTAGTESEYTPIFIVGMHRSGTTLLEQILDGHRDVRGVGELYDFTNQMRYATDRACRGPIDPVIIERASSIDFAEVGRRYIEKMEWRLGQERFFTDKLPSNFFNVGFICEALPTAKILHMVRDPVETCFSNLRELFSDVNAYSYDQLELADFYHQYKRLMAHWHKAYPGRILDIDYARLTADPEVTMREVSAFCGLEFDPAMLDVQRSRRGVATASAIQVRQAITARDQPKWKPYEQFLQPLIRGLERTA
jgi:tetratricopeptide (TPR) repeat protein